MAQKRADSEDEKFEVQLQAEAELAQLQRQYGIMAHGRAEFSEAISPQYQKQKHVLSIWKRERDELNLDLNVANNPSKRKADRKTLNQLQSLLDEYASFNEKIAAKREHLEEIDEQIKMVKKDIVDLKSKMVSHSQCDERLWIGMKHLETLENKLEVQVKKFCSIRAQNCAMREQIEYLLMERVNFMKIWDKAMCHLSIGKKFMLDLIEQASLAYDQREEWCSKLQALRLKAHGDLIQHTQHMGQLVCKRESNDKFMEFIQTKGQKRVMRDLRIKKLDKHNEKKQTTDELLTKYQGYINDILEFSKEGEVEAVAAKFLLSEANNFGLFQNVNNLNKELEELNEQLMSLQIDVDDEKKLHEQRRHHQESKLNRLQNLLDEMIEMKNYKQNKLAEINSELEAVIAGVDNLFKLCKCSNDPLLQLLGNFSTINYKNVLLHQLILEQKVSDLMLFAYHRDKIKRLKAGERLIKEETHQKILKIEQFVSTNPCPLCVEHEVVSDVIDVVQKCWTREEVKQKLTKRLALPDGAERVHNVSACHLPKSREIIQKRYQ